MLSSVARDVMAMSAFNCHSDGDAMPLRQQRPFDPCLPAVSWIRAGLFSPQAVLWSLPRPYSAMPSQCPLVHQIARRRLATVSETRQQRPMLESDHRPWIWRTGLSRSTPPTDSQCAAHKRWHQRTGGQVRAGDRRQTDVYSREQAGAVPAQPRVRPRCESQSWSGCSACAHECALIFVQCSPH